MTGKAGALALVGSGEFLDVMNSTDAMLIKTLGGPEQTRVAVIPTASGLESGMPQRWAEMGLSHFGKLGAQVQAAMIISRDDTNKPEILDTLRNSNFFYFSGGNPGYVIQIFRDTPAWEIITQAHLNGAVLAGCSAGAMAFGGYTLNIRQAMSGQIPDWVPALGLLPNIITFPHFDRMSGFLTADRFNAVIESVPAGTIMLGVDEDTALVRTNISGEWLVSGHQTVSVLNAPGGVKKYKVGDVVQLG